MTCPILLVWKAVIVSLTMFALFCALMALQPELSANWGIQRPWYSDRSMALSFMLSCSLRDLHGHIILFLANVGQIQLCNVHSRDPCRGMKNTLHGQIVLPSEILWEHMHTWRSWCCNDASWACKASLVLWCVASCWAMFWFNRAKLLTTAFCLSSAIMLMRFWPDNTIFSARTSSRSPATLAPYLQHTLPSQAGSHKSFHPRLSTLGIAYYFCWVVDSEQGPPSVAEQLFCSAAAQLTKGTAQ